MCCVFKLPCPNCWNFPWGMFMFFPWEVLVLNYDDVLTFGCGPRIKKRCLIPAKGLNEVPMKGFDDEEPTTLDEAPNRVFK